MVDRSVTTADLIAEGALEIGDGYRAKNVEFASGGLPFARVKNLTNRFDFSTVDYLPKSVLRRVGRKISQPGDCVISMKGSVGRVAYVNGDLPQFVYSPQLSYWRVLDTEVIHPRYLQLWMQSPEFVYQCAQVKGSTDMADYVNLRDQRRMRITIPPISTQRAIAEMIGAIDDLIENNRRRIEILEEMARLLYREWFVHFQYPGHEGIALVDSELGPIPEGWSVSRTSELISSGELEIGDGYRAKSSEMTGGPLRFLRVKNVQECHFMGLEDADSFPLDCANVVGPKQSKIGDIAIAMKGSVGRLARVEESTPPLVYSPQTSYWRVVLPGRVSSTFLYEWMQSPSFVQQCAQVKGATDMADYVNLTDQRNMMVLLPSEELVAMFGGQVDPMLELASNLGQQNRVLRDARDLLLPRLVSGELDVSDLDLDGVLA